MNVLITGGTKGIGKAAALRFAAPGNNIFMNYVHDDHSANISFSEVEKTGAIPHLLKYDVGNVHEVSEMARSIESKVDHLDVIVHCAVSAIKGDALEIGHKDWMRAVEVSSLSLINVVRECRPLLKTGSSIIALSSKGSVKAVPKYAALGATKAFTESIVRYLAVELAPSGIRANVVSAGAVDTEAFRSVFGEKAADRLAKAAKMNPRGRALTVEDIANMIYLISQPEAEMLNGEIIHVDGGLSLR